MDSISAMNSDEANNARGDAQPGQSRDKDILNALEAVCPPQITKKCTPRS